MSRLPPWLWKLAEDSGPAHEVVGALGTGGLRTICQEARCPNQGECFSRGRLTFLILGDICTRHCPFCPVRHGQPTPPDPGEAAKIAEVSRHLGLEHVVLTSVTRDDLPDGGAGAFSRAVRALRAEVPGVRVEVLVPDFAGSGADLEGVLEARPHTLAHNLETVPRLYPRVRPQADYQRSLALLRRASASSPVLLTKAGLMLGMGEEYEEVVGVLEDLATAGVSFLTLGQYLPPSPHHYPLERYVTPREFAHYRRLALALGFRGVASGPWVRSSYAF